MKIPTGTERMEGSSDALGRLRSGGCQSALREAHAPNRFKASSDCLNAPCDGGVDGFEFDQMGAIDTAHGSGMGTTHSLRSTDNHRNIPSR